MDFFQPDTSPQLFTPSLLDLSSHDAEEMREQSVYWSFEHKQFGRGKFSGKILGAHTRRLQLSLSTRTTGIFIRGSIPDNTTVISFPVPQSLPLYYRGQLLEQFQSIAIKAHEELDLQTTSPSTLLTIAVSAELLEQQTLAVTGKTFDELRHNERLSIRPDAYNTITDRLFSLLQTLHTSPAHRSSWEEKILENTILQMVLKGVRAPIVRREKAQRSSFARRAEKYIRSNLKRPLSVSALSRAVGTSERSLHMGFKERFGVSPKCYMQIMRLNGVHDDLCREAAGKNVSDTAMEWGFYHLGRFAQQYKRLFGELPGNTKRRTC